MFLSHPPGSVDTAHALGRPMVAGTSEQDIFIQEGGLTMPWKVKKGGPKGWLIVKADTGKVVGHSTSKAKAEASVRARYANSADARK